MADSSVVDILQSHPEVAVSVPFEKLNALVVIARHLKPRIALNNSSQLRGPPAALPVSVHRFLCAAVGVEHELMKMSWHALRGHVWATTNSDGQAMAYLDLFLEYGQEYEVGESDLLHLLEHIP